MKLTLRTFFLGMALCCSPMATADFAVVDSGNVGTFSKTDVAALKAQTVYYGYRVTPYTDWSGIEKKVLNLHSAFAPEKRPGKNPQPLVMYVAKVNFQIDKPAAQIDVKRFLNLQLVQNLDKTIVQTAISPSDVITYKQNDLTFRNPPAPARWCDDRNSTLCLRTEFTLPAVYQNAFAIYEKLQKSSYTTLEGQSELHVASGKDIANVADLRLLTGLNTDPTAVFEQTVFWITHAVEYIKIVGVIQPHPLDANKSLITGYMAFGIEKKTWEKKVMGFEVQKLILGQSGNTKDGVLSGLPKLTQHLSVSLADMFQK